MTSPHRARPGWAYLVGAGPGDPDLLTLRGAQLLATADVVLHDELLDRSVLTHTRNDAEVIAVGTRGRDANEKQRKQDAIIDQMVAHAHAGRSVVRLKGGDPMLFGRGAEETAALREASIPFEVVPGVSAPLGATAYAGIPLTHRALAQSFTCVTAIQRAGTLFDWRKLAGLDGTLCVFMGTRHLATICEALVAQAKRKNDTPAAIVGSISFPHQRTVVGNLGNLAQRATEAEIESPALLIVGEVVSLRSDASWFEQQPLFGKRVLLLRPAHQVEPTAHLLRRRGAQPLSFPAIEIGPPPDAAPVRRALEALNDYALIAFTSDNGVRSFWRFLAETGRDARALGPASVAAIGPATAARLATLGVNADIVAPRFIAEELATSIIDHLESHATSSPRVLLPRALVARETLPQMLRAAGIEVDIVPVYETRFAPQSEAESLRSNIAASDIILFTSSSTVTSCCRLLGAKAAAVLGKIMVASIGPITSQTLDDLGVDIDVTATISTTEGLIDAVADQLAASTPKQPEQE
jgi:uroporphyrinogen III methyltransferase/synthase